MLHQMIQVQYLKVSTSMYIEIQCDCNYFHLMMIKIIWLDHHGASFFLNLQRGIPSWQFLFFCFK